VGLLVEGVSCLLSPPGAGRTTEASSVEGTAMGSRCAVHCSGRVWTTVAAERPILRRWPSPKWLGKSHTAQFTERCTWWAVRRRSVLCTRGRCDASRCLDCRCAALPLPYFGWRGALGEWASVFGVGSGAG